MQFFGEEGYSLATADWEKLLLRNTRLTHDVDCFPIRNDYGTCSFGNDIGAG
jgi:hypothetical protein